MKKTSRATRKSTTHFEQVPLEIVKRIADREASKTQKPKPDNVIVEPMSRKTEPYMWGCTVDRA
jgi:hypothetical protein